MTDPDGDPETVLVCRDPDLQDAGFPYDAFDELIRSAEQQFEANLDVYGPGRHWLGSDPSVFANDAMAKIAPTANGDGLRIDEFGDAANYLAFGIDADREADEEAVTGGGEQEKLVDEDPFGIVDLAIGDVLRVTYDTPRSDYEQKRTGTVAKIGTVEKERAPTGTTEVVLSRRDEGDVILWPAWDEIRTDAAGTLGEITKVNRMDRRDDQSSLQTDGGLDQLHPVTDGCIDELQLASDHVGDIADAVGVNDAARERAVALARRADFDHPINRKPSAVAAGCVYLASVLERGQKRTQDTIVAAAGVSVPALRESFYALLEAEGFENPRDVRPEGGEDLDPSLIDRLRDAVPWYDGGERP